MIRLIRLIRKIRIMRSDNREQGSERIAKDNKGVFEGEQGEGIRV